MSDQQAFATAQPDAGAAAALETSAVASLELLDGGEVIERSFRPSPWYIAIVSARTAILLIIVAATAKFLAGSPSYPLADLIVVVALLAALGRVGLASLQWAGRLYVLTNRRVLRFSGVFNVRIAECPLVQIGRLDLHVTSVHRLLRLGSIRMIARDGSTVSLIWNHVARPSEVHAWLNAAIHKAQSH